ncbi:ATP-binding protein [Cellulosimicrobium sp. NPDC057127]|uniref:ATP-binding protein n=1 Tax=Cellulosimicrobium sp. NPDC057127 TaxID=3346026 RepID=UPI00362C1CE2
MVMIRAGRASGEPSSSRRPRFGRARPTSERPAPGVWSSVPSSAGDSAECSLAAVSSSIATARRWATAQTNGHGAPVRTVSAVELGTSELVANAIQHAGSQTAIRLRIHSRPRALRLEVHDGSADAPRRRPGRAGLAGGHGLHILDQITNDWGWEHATGGGKLVWASFSW